MPEAQLNRLQVLQLLLIALALPAQYILVQWTGDPTEVSRVHSIKSIIASLRQFYKKYFTLESWKTSLMRLVEQQDEVETTPKYGRKTVPIVRPRNDECVAEEVFWYRSPHGYFASSSKPRSPRSPRVKYRVGQVLKHKQYGYRGVIIGWDETCKAPEHWIQANHQGHTEYRNKANYSVLVDSRDRGEIQTTYVAEDNIEIVKNTKVEHVSINDYFDFYDGAQYHMRPAIKQIYPYD